MAAIEQQIAVRIKALVEGLPQVQALSNAVIGLSKIKAGGSNGLAGTAQQVVNLGNVSDKTIKNLSKLFTGFQDISKGFASGATNIKGFTSELGGAARQLKTITDQSRLLPAAGSIQLPARNPVFQTLKPLVDAEPAINRTNRSLRTENEIISSVEKNARQLAEAFLAADAAAKKMIASQASALHPKINQRFNELIGNTTGSSNPLGGITGGAGLFGNQVRPTEFLAAYNQKLKETDAAAQGAGKSLNTAAEGSSRLLSSLGRSLVIGAVFAAIFTVINDVKQAISTAIDLVKEFISQGVAFNSTIEKSRVGLATIISNNFDIRDSQGKLVEGVDAFNAGLTLANQQMSKLQKAALETEFNFEDLVGALVQASSAVAGTNVGLNETVDLVVKASRAASAINLSGTEFATQLRQVLTGAVRVQTRLAQAIFPGQNSTQINSQIRSFRQAGTLAEELEKRLAKIQFAASAVANTFEALSQNAADAFKIFEGTTVLGLFDEIKQALKFITSQIIDTTGETLKLTPTFQKLADILGTILTEIGSKLLGFLKSAFDFFNGWVDSLSLSHNQLLDIADAVVEIARQVVLMLGDVLGIVTAMINIDGSSGDILTKFNHIAQTIGVIRDIINIIQGIVQASVTGILFLVVGLVQAIADGIDRCTLGATNLASKLDGVRLALGGAFAAGLDRIVSGVEFTATRNAGITPRTPETAAQIHQRHIQEELTRVQNRRDFTATPSRTPGGNAGAADRIEKEQLRARRQLLDALAKLQEARAKQEVDLEKDTNSALMKDLQRRYDAGVVSVEDFYKRKHELDTSDIAAEETFLNKKKQILTGFLRRDVGNLFGLDKVGDDKLNELVQQAAQLKEGGLVNVEPKTLNAIKLIVDYNKDILEINTELKKLDTDRHNSVKDTINELDKQRKASGRLLSDLNAEIADAFNKTGVADAINLTRKISDEFKNVLLNTNPATDALRNFAHILDGVGDIDLEQLNILLDAAGIQIENLSPATQRWMELIGRKDAINNLATISGEIDKIQSKLTFDIEGVRTGFDLGDSALGQSAAEIDRLTNESIPKLEAKFNELKELITAPNSKFTQEDVQNVEAIGRALARLKSGGPKLELIDASNKRATDELGQALDAIAIKRERFAISANEADKLEIAAKQQLIDKLQEELAIAESLNQAVPENAAKVTDLINQIGTLQNEVHHNTLDIAHGIEQSIGGAFSNFFDTILQGNQSILDSFRQVVAQMLGEIAKLIFQAFVLKAIMSALNNVFGGFFFCGGGAGASGAGVGGALAGAIGGLAEGGIVSGPGTGVSDSVPAMLSHGEAVIPARRVNAYGRGLIQSMISGSFIPMRGFARFAEGGFAGAGNGSSGHGGGRGTRIVNLVDKSFVSDFLNSSEGEDVILNIIGRNPGVVQRLA